MSGRFSFLNEKLLSLPYILHAPCSVVYGGFYVFLLEVIARGRGPAFEYYVCFVLLDIRSKISRMKLCIQKIRFGLIGLSLILSTAASANETGKALYEQLCVSCHLSEGASAIAPPMFAVINHVKGTYPDRDEFIERVVDLGI